MLLQDTMNKSINRNWTRQRKVCYYEKQKIKFRRKKNSCMKTLILSCQSIWKYNRQNIFIRYSICSIGDLIEQLNENNYRKFMNDYNLLVNKWYDIFMLLERMYLKKEYNDKNNSITKLYKLLITNIFEFKIKYRLIQDDYNNTFLFKSFNFMDYLYGKVYYEDEFDYNYFVNNLFDPKIYPSIKKIVINYKTIIDYMMKEYEINDMIESI